MRALFTVIASLAVIQSASDDAFRVRRIDPGQSETAALADLDNDGRLDIVSSDSWYEAPNWTKHPLRTIPVTNNYLDNFSDLPIDVDGDGYVDVVQIGYFARRIVWIRNPGTSGGPWTVHDIDAVGPTEFAFLVDLDNDGKRNELLPEFTGAAQKGLCWYELQRGAWIKHEVASQSFGHGVGAGDINGDGRADIVTPRGWLEAPRDSRVPGTWTLHETDWMQLQLPVGSKSPAASQPGATAVRDLAEFGFMYVLDVNNDGRNDVLTTLAHSFGIVWFEQTAARTWTQHMIDNTWSRSHASMLADVNGDGQLDLVTGTRFMGRNAQETEPLAVYWYEYKPTRPAGGAGSGAATEVQWIRHTISSGDETGAGLELAVGDVDHDGDADVVLPGKSGLFLAEHVRATRGARGVRDARWPMTRQFAVFRQVFR